ncbi:MAG TPA: MFS transporter [Candidatus Limnocylindria bacterium]|nr:MFS transporter [Candidatus Limnocylindria bacterium]
MRRFLPPRLALLALGHFSIDAYSSFYTPLLPLLIAKLNLSLTLVGTLVALASLTGSFAQPLFGWISDRLYRPWFVALGPIVAALLLSSVGLASSYWGLVGLLMLGGIGVAAFHPQAAVLASEAAPKRSMAMAVFVSGGTLGFSLGPLFAVAIVGMFGLERTWIAALPGVLVGAVLLAWFGRERPRPRLVGPRPRVAELRPVLRPLVLLYLAVVVRSAVSLGFMTFLPIELTRRGVSVGNAGALVTLYLMAGALGGFFGGWLSDRWGGRRVVIMSFLGAAPLFFAFVFLPFLPGLVCLVLGSFVLQTSLPVNVVMGQELSPRHSSTISSLLMGAAWGVGAVMVSPVGAIADAFGLETGLTCLAALLTGGAACALALPDIRAKASPTKLASPVTGAAGK